MATQKLSLRPSQLKNAARIADAIQQLESVKDELADVSVTVGGQSHDNPLGWCVGISVDILRETFRASVDKKLADYRATLSLMGIEIVPDGVEG
jgi:hypothetical protein